MGEVKGEARKRVLVEKMDEIVVPEINDQLGTIVLLFVVYSICRERHVSHSLRED